MRVFYDCTGCKAALRPKPGDCCVFCSHADRGRAGKQEEKKHERLLHGEPANSPIEYRSSDAGRSRPDTLPYWVGQQTLHVDGSDAAGRRGQARSRRRREPLPRFQDPRDVRQPNHTAPHDDPHVRIRGRQPRHIGERSESGGSDRPLAGEPHPRSCSAARRLRGLLELRNRPRGLCRPARIRDAMGGLHRTAYSHPARDAAHECPSADTRGAPYPACRQATISRKADSSRSPGSS